jgi:hypothetical protein
MSAFTPGSIFDNVDKFANSLGYQNLGIVMKLSVLPWDSTDDRDAFIEAITQEQPQGGKPKRRKV